MEDIQKMPYWARKNGSDHIFTLVHDHVGARLRVQEERVLLGTQNNAYHVLANVGPGVWLRGLVVQGAGSSVCGQG